MSNANPLDELSVAEKVRLLESVWQSLCAHTGDVQSPEWHREVLDTRRKRIQEGEASVSSWTDAKARLLRVGQ